MKRVYTLKMQAIGLKHPTLIGIDFALFNRVQAAYEEYVNFKKIGAPLNLKQIENWRYLDLLVLRLSEDDICVINTQLQKVGFYCDPAAEWVSQKLLTLHMQHLLESHVTEIGIGLRLANTLEEYCGIIKLSDLLKFKWEQLESLCGNVGGIYNFGRKHIASIKECLKEHGFVGTKDTIWIIEQPVSNDKLVA